MPAQTRYCATIFPFFYSPLLISHWPHSFNKFLLVGGPGVFSVSSHHPKHQPLKIKEFAQIIHQIISIPVFLQRKCRKKAGFARKSAFIYFFSLKFSKTLQNPSNVRVSRRFVRSLSVSHRTSGPFLGLPSEYFGATVIRFEPISGAIAS